MTELNISSNSMTYGSAWGDMSGVIALADVISDMGAILSANLLKNRIGVAQAEVLVSILKEHPTLKSLCGNKGNETELDMSGKMWGAEDAIMLIAEIVDNGALSYLSLSKNALLTKEAGKVIGDMLKGNSTLKEFDLSSNYDYHSGAKDGPGFAQELADGIKDNGALSTLSLKDNRLLTAEAGKILSDMLAANTVLKELDLSSNRWYDRGWKGDGPGFAQQLAVGIKDNGALSSFTFGDKQAVTMTTLMADANFSGKLKSYEAQIVAAFLPKCT
jgi:hypothetical protein